MLFCFFHSSNFCQIIVVLNVLFRLRFDQCVCFFLLRFCCFFLVFVKKFYIQIWLVYIYKANQNMLMFFFPNFIIITFIFGFFFCYCCSFVVQCSLYKKHHLSTYQERRTIWILSLFSINWTDTMKKMCSQTHSVKIKKKEVNLFSWRNK